MVAWKRNHAGEIFRRDHPPATLDCPDDRTKLPRRTDERKRCWVGMKVPKCSECRRERIDQCREQASYRSSKYERPASVFAPGCKEGNGYDQRLPAEAPVKYDQDCLQPRVPREQRRIGWPVEPKGFVNGSERGIREWPAQGRHGEQYEKGDDPLRVNERRRFHGASQSFVPKAPQKESCEQQPQNP